MFKSPNALRDELFDVPVTVKDGIAHVPMGPGLGISVNTSAMKSFEIRETEIK